MTATVYTVPAAPAGTGSSSCGNGTVTLLASGAGTGQNYKWYAAASGGVPLQTGGATFTTPSISTTTTFYVSVYDTTTGCESGRTAVTAVNNALPLVTITASGPTTFCAGGSVTLTAHSSGTPTAYQWNTGATTPAIFVSAPGTYQVTVTDSTGCLSTSPAVVVSVPTPTFSGLASISPVSYDSSCGFTLAWADATSACPNNGSVVYNVYRSTVAGFVPSRSNLLKACVTANFYNDVSVGTITTFYYVVRAEDAGIGSTGPCNGGDEDGNFVRLSGTIPTGTSCVAKPQDVQAFTATSASGQNVLEWANPASGGYASTMVRFRTDTFPVSPTDGSLATTSAGSLGAHDSYSHGALVNGTTYYYTAFVNNGSGLYSAGKSIAARPQTVTGPVKWVYNTDSSALVPPAIGSVYVLSNDHLVHSINPYPGNGEWPSGWIPPTLGAPAQARPPVVDLSIGTHTKELLLGSQDGRVRCVDGNSGQIIWTSPLLGEMIQGAAGGIFQAYGGAYDLVIVGTRNSGSYNSLYGLKAYTGALAWEFDNGAGVDATKGIGIIAGDIQVDYGGNRAYFASRQAEGGSPHTVWCVQFTGTTATLVWTQDLGDIDGSVVLAGGVLYVGTNTGHVHALDAGTGQAVWAAPLATGDGPIKGSVWPDYVVPGRVFFTTTSKAWCATTVGGTPQVQWSANVPGASAPLVVGDKLTVGSSDGHLYVITNLGSTTPSVTTVVIGDGTSVVGTPSYDFGSGTYYVGTDGGSIYALSFP